MHHIRSTIVAQSNVDHQSKINDYSLRTWRLSHNDELYGSIGPMMKGSGLEEALETVYGPNALTHMMSGKAVSRALPGHLVEAALVNTLMMSVFPCRLNGNDTSRI